MMWSKLRTLGVIATGLLVPSLLAGCGESAPKQDRVLDVAFRAEISNLDHTFTTKRAYIILSQLTDTYLFYVDPETLEYVPLAAKSYTFRDDTTLDITLRDGITFHDGTTLTAEDVVYTYRWITDPAHGARAMRHVGQWLKSVEKTGPMSVRFHLEYAYPLVLRDMAITVPLRDEGSYEKNGKINKKALVLDENGAGPYKVVKFSPGQEVVLERYEDYFENSPKGMPTIDNIRIRTMPDWGSQAAAMRSDDLDFMYNVPPDVAANLAKTDNAKLVEGEAMRIGFIQLDAAGITGADNPLTKLNVRRGLNHAINREAIVSQLVRGKSKVINSACNPIQFGCEQDVMTYDYDPQRARELFAQAGYPNGFSLDLWAYRERLVAEAIAGNLREVGIDVNLRYVKLPVLNKARAEGEIQSYFGTWGAGGTADVAATLNVLWNMHTDRNLARDETIAAKVKAASQTRDKTERRALYSAVLKRIAKKAYYVPLYAYPKNYVVAEDVVFKAPRDGLTRLFLARWKQADRASATE